VSVSGHSFAADRAVHEVASDAAKLGDVMHLGLASVTFDFFDHERFWFEP
jgi:hypothetical protein